MKWIELSNNSRSFCVDDEDYDKVRVHKWYWVDNGPNGFQIIARIYGKTWTIGRFILQPKDGSNVDHHDRDGLNNLRSNLREASDLENNQNATKRVDGLSGFKGVGYYRKYRNWVARIQVKGIRYFLGYFSSEKEAALAYNEAAKKYFKEFAVLNRVD